MLRVLLIGREPDSIKQIQEKEEQHVAMLYVATTSEEAVKVLAEHNPHAIIMEAGVDLEQRIAIVRAAFQRSDTVEVHLKDAASDAEGFTKFVEEILGMLRRQKRKEDQTNF